MIECFLGLILGFEVITPRAVEDWLEPGLAIFWIDDTPFEMEPLPVTIPSMSKGFGSVSDYLSTRCSSSLTSDRLDFST